MSCFPPASSLDSDGSSIINQWFSAATGGTPWNRLLDTTKLELLHGDDYGSCIGRAGAAAEVDASATEGVPFLALFCSSVLSGSKAVRRTS